MTEKTPPAVAEWLLAFSAGPAWEDAVIGDFRETFERDHQTRLQYWSDAVRSLPGVLTLSLGNVSLTQFARELVLLVGLCSLIWLWEFNVAQGFAWPVAADLSHLSPLSPAQTCKAAYVCLFTTGVMLLFGIWIGGSMLAKPSWRASALRLFIVIAACLSPIIYFLVFPGQHDGEPTYRYVQIALLSGTALFVIAKFRGRLASVELT